MFIARVMGNVVSTKKDNRLVGFKLLTIQPLKSGGIYGNELRVAVDPVGAGIGEDVLVVEGFAARQAAGGLEFPVDAAIVGIVDAAD